MRDPIEALAYKVAITVKKWDPGITEHVEDIRYKVAYYINYYSVIVISLLIGVMTNELIGTCLSLISFGILRKYTGGYHLKTLTGCAVLTIFLLSLIPHIYMGFFIPQILNIVSFLLVFFFSSKGNHARYLSLMLIGSNLILNSPVVSLAFAIQSILLINSRR
ncbi:accessory gene regulator B family protein [Paenibacillus alba]|uniref:accessory gene regulator B family protein n=1 Tax=Paenibacillus alba TaxID=1197127 RepID=UPI00398AEF4F